MKDLWPTKYVGLPWESGARGPAKFDCWGILQKIYREELEVTLPAYQFDSDSPFSTSAKIATNQIGRAWKELAKPAEFSVVALSKSVKFFHHVGVWTNLDGGRIIHSESCRGVVSQSISAMKNNGWKQFKFYGFIERNQQPVSS